MNCKSQMINAELLKVFGNFVVVEVAHLIDHPDGRLDDRIGTEGSGAFAQAQAKIEQWLHAHTLEHQLVAALIAAMAKDGKIEE